MERQRRRVLFLFGIWMLAMASHAAWAKVESKTVTTTAGRTFSDWIAEKGFLTYLGIFRGSPLGSLGNAYQPKLDGTADLSNPLGLESIVNMGYKINPDLIVGMTGHFNYFPVGNPVGTGHNIQMLDPALMLMAPNLVNNEGFTLAARLFVFLPLTSADTLVSNHLATAISPTLILNYAIPKTSLSVGVFSYIRGYIPTASAADNALSYKFYVAPTMAYQLTDRLTATLWVDLVQVSRNRNTGFFSGMNNAAVDIEPGISWQITNNISFNPSLNIYPSNPTLAATSFMAFIAIKAL